MCHLHFSWDLVLEITLSGFVDVLRVGPRVVCELEGSFLFSGIEQQGRCDLFDLGNSREGDLFTKLQHKRGSSANI